MQLVVPRAVSAAEMAATIIRRITSHVDLLSFIVVCLSLFIVHFPKTQPADSPLTEPLVYSALGRSIVMSRSEPMRTRSLTKSRTTPALLVNLPEFSSVCTHVMPVFSH